MTSKASELHKLRTELVQHINVLTSQLKTAKQSSNYDNNEYAGRLRGQRDMAEFVLKRVKKIQKLPKDD